MNGHAYLKKHFVAYLTLIVSCLGTTGCLSAMLAKRIVQAPNQQSAPKIVTDKKYADLMNKTYSKVWSVPVSNPSAELSVALVEPADYHLEHSLVVNDTGDGHGNWTVNFKWRFPERTVQPLPAKGTIILLHGILVSKDTMLHWALYLAQEGYRSVLVDLRGHGLSTGDWIGYGAFEAHDLKQVLDDLEARGLASGKVGVLGVSYGASVALQFAALDPRVKAVVALEPFSDPEKAVVEFGRGYFKKLTARLSDRDFSSALNRASHLAHFSWSQSDVIIAVEKTSAPILFFHGGKDSWISPENSRILVAHARPPSRLEIVKNDDHVMLATRLDPIASEVATWFGKTLLPEGAALARDYPRRDGSAMGGYIMLDFALRQ